MWLTVPLVNPFDLSESTDPEFDSNQRSFAEMEKAAEKLLKDAKTFSEAVTCTYYLPNILSDLT